VCVRSNARVCPFKVHDWAPYLAALIVRRV